MNIQITWDQKGMWKASCPALGAESRSPCPISAVSQLLELEPMMAGWRGREKYKAAAHNKELGAPSHEQMAEPQESKHMETDREREELKQLGAGQTSADIPLSNGTLRGW